MADKEIILITGSSGYIGRSLAARLVEKYHVIGLDLGIPERKIPNVIYKSLDISSPKNIENVLDEIHDEFGARINSVIHLVAYYSFSGQPSSKYQEITVEGTKNFLSSLRRHFHLDQFIFSSTMLVHAPTRPCDKISEDSEVAAGWPYPQSKVAAENAINEVKGDTRVVFLRMAGVYDDYGHSIPIGHHIARVYEQQISSALFPGNANHGQSYLHLEDLIHAMELLVEKKGELPSELTLLLGEEDVMTYRELQESIGELLHETPWPTIKIPAFIARCGAYVQQRTPFMREPFIKPWMIEFADDHYELNMSKVRSELNWSPTHTLRETLPKMIGALKENPEKWYKEHKMTAPAWRGLVTSEAEENSYRTMAILNIFLGIWLFANPFTYGDISRGEFWSEVISGVLITITATLSLFPTLRWVRWVNTVFASWVMFSPLVFWTNSAASYSMDTLLASFILLASAYTPSKEPNAPSELPPGWTYNPSSWRQRLPIMMLGFTGFLLAKYLAAFQLGFIPNAWDPFFGNGTETILHSDVSKAFPVSDAALGALSYILDVIAAAVGDKNRWRTMPWMVILFGLFIVPTGVTSITLVMLQPIGVGAWCTICLIASFVMLIMVPPSVDEVCASVQFLRRSVRSGRPFWRTFWFGDKEVEGEFAKPKLDEGGIPYNLVASTVLGCWLMATPGVFGITGSAANNIWISGALITTFAVIAFAEVARIVRFLNVIFGAWLVLSTFFIGEIDLGAKFHSLIIGIALVALSIPRGKISEHFGSLDKWVRWTLLDFARWYQHRKTV